MVLIGYMCVRLLLLIPLIWCFIELCLLSLYCGKWFLVPLIFVIFLVWTALSTTQQKGRQCAKKVTVTPNTSVENRAHSACIGDNSGSKSYLMFQHWCSYANKGCAPYRGGRGVTEAFSTCLFPYSRATLWLCLWWKEMAPSMQCLNKWFWILISSS